MRVLFATPEMEDFISVGGLAAVSAALPRALRSLSDIRVIIPGYREVLRRLQPLETVAHCEAVAALPACTLALSKTHDGLPVYVVICSELYERDGGPYGDAHNKDWSDNDIRFARFASVTAQLAAGLLDPNWKPGLVHCNDWQSALVPAYLAWDGAAVPTVLTIHNLAYQGLFEPETLQRIGAPDSAFHVDGLEFYGKASFLKAGLVYASHLTTVSTTYAREITTAEHGCGLEGLLQRRADARQLSGILNGIDDSWDPRTCSALAAPFASGEWDAKDANADHARKEFGLALSRGPLFGLVARLVHQKGVDLVLAAADTVVKAGGQIIVTGKGEPRFEKALKEAEARNRENFSAAIRFDDGEARRIFAGSDFTLMPSRFEPCGLSQMYAQRFGSLPIGRETGGLTETIVDGETGFLFSEASAESLLGGISRAFATFRAKHRLNRMRARAMSQNFGWRHSARNYGQLYNSVAA
ncbi:MAG: glycogen synthase GlgA [Alphaproteobacteria bacterium]|nr:glycogen synthase GlgA [Alphaproteobacteria bacterium]